MALGRTDDAKPLLDEAEAECRRAGQTPTDVWLVKAKLAAAEHQSAGALHWIEAVNNSTQASPAQREEAALLQGEIACDQHDVAQARAQLEAARQRMASANPLRAASIERLSGRVALLEGQAAEAGAAFDREAEFCSRAGQKRAMAHALARAGDAYAKAGVARSAVERTYRATRSLFAQGDLPAALPLLARARQTAVLAGDAALAQRLESLADEIERASH